MCMSTFCALPFGWHGWDEEARPIMTLFLPFVGTFIGAIWTALALLLRYFELPASFFAAVLCAFPFLITGGIHMDGFLDVTDAVKSWRDIEERRKILKDPHVGSFAVLHGILLILVQFSLFCSLKPEAEYLSLLLIAVTSRSMAALCVTIFRPMSTSEYSGTYRKGIKSSHMILLLGILSVTVASGFLFLGKYGFVSLAVIAGYLIQARRAIRSLGGMSGDVSGYAMTFAELCGIAVFALI